MFDFKASTEQHLSVLLVRPLTSKVPAFSRLTWSFSGRSRKPGILLAKSTTSCTAGVKLMENSSQISWLGLQGSTYGDVFMGQTWRNVKMKGQSGTVIKKKEKNLKQVSKIMNYSPSVLYYSHSLLVHYSHLRQFVCYVRAVFGCLLKVYS